MTQEEKQLLLKDLCGRLPYRVRARFCDGVKEEIDDVWDIDMFSGAINVDYIIDDVKPYLRPMSSITEEEKKKVHYYVESHKHGDCSRRGVISDYLNSIHVDYRGLIEKGLALEAQKEMYKEN